MKVNGQRMAGAAPVGVTALIRLGKLRPDRGAVEVNGLIVPRAQRDTRQLNDGDSVEIVSFVQGG